LSLSNMIRWGGLAALLAGVLFAISDLVGALVLDYENFSETAATGTYAFLSLVYLLSAVLLRWGWSGCTLISRRRQGPSVWWPSW
jgi:drug/metabolite transporter (DMT)-like permease